MAIGREMSAQQRDPLLLRSQPYGAGGLDSGDSMSFGTGFGVSQLMIREETSLSAVDSGFEVRIGTENINGLFRIKVAAGAVRTMDSDQPYQKTSAAYGVDLGVGPLNLRFMVGGNYVMVDKDFQRAATGELNLIYSLPYMCIGSNLYTSIGETASSVGVEHEAMFQLTDDFAMGVLAGIKETRYRSDEDIRAHKITLGVPLQSTDSSWLTVSVMPVIGITMYSRDGAFSDAITGGMVVDGIYEF